LLRQTDDMLFLLGEIKRLASEGEPENVESDRT